MAAIRNDAQSVRLSSSNCRDNAPISSFSQTHEDAQDAVRLNLPCKNAPSCDTPSPRAIMHRQLSGCTREWSHACRSRHSPASRTSSDLGSPHTPPAQFAGVAPADRPGGNFSGRIRSPPINIIFLGYPYFLEYSISRREAVRPENLAPHLAADATPHMHLGLGVYVCVCRTRTHTHARMHACVYACMHAHVLAYACPHTEADADAEPFDHAAPSMKQLISGSYEHTHLVRACVRAGGRAGGHASYTHTRTNKSMCS